MKSKVPNNFEEGYYQSSNIDNNMFIIIIIIIIIIINNIIKLSKSTKTKAINIYSFSFWSGFH